MYQSLRREQEHVRSQGLGRYLTPKIMHGIEEWERQRIREAFFEAAFFTTLRRFASFCSRYQQRQMIFSRAVLICGRQALS